MNKFKIRLKELRLEKKLTQKQLGIKVNLSLISISHYESGYTEPSIDTLIGFAKFFKVSLDYLIGLED